MLPQFYQACVQAQLSQAQFITLQMLVELLQKERGITLERLAMLVAQPIQLESRRNVQRFLSWYRYNPRRSGFLAIPLYGRLLDQQGQSNLDSIGKTSARATTLTKYGI